MAPNIDWDVVSNVAGGKSKIDDETIDRVVEDLRAVQEEDFKNDPDKLVLLFKSALNIFNHREQEFEGLLEEQAASAAEKDSEIEQLQRRIEEERKYEERFSGRDTEYLRAENRNLSELMEGYAEREKELKTELDEAVRDKALLERENNELKHQNNDLKMEVQDMKADVREYRDIMENQQRERLDVKGHIDSEMREKLVEKNEQISDLLTQITQLEKVNKDLEKGNRGVRDEMERAQQDMEKMADEYEKMKRVIDGTDHYSENVQKQNAAYKIQVADLREQLKAKKEELDAIIGTVNGKVDEWKVRLTEKDKLLLENTRTIAALREQISSAALDQDRIAVERLTKRLKEKEEQIKQLQTSLEQVIIDLDAQTAIVQDLRKDSGTNKETIAYRSQIKSLQEKVRNLEDKVQDAESHRLAAEEEATVKDRELNAALKRITDMQTGEYGLSEAVQEIKECKAQIKIRDQNIEELVKQVNALEEKLNDILEENEEFRERLGVNPRDMTDIVKMKKSRALRQQQYRAENQVLLKEIERLEDERIEMKQQIRELAQTHSQRAMSEGLQQDDLDLIDDFIEDLKRKRKISKPTKSKGVRFGGKTLRQDWRVEELNKQADEAESNLQGLRVENARLKEEKRSLVKENTDLKNGMKEILEAIKKSQAQGKSADIFEIPSLERLINAIEVKDIHGEYDPALHMKAQMDQLTGRNDELRRELRTTRGELAEAVGKNSNMKSKNEALKTENFTLSKLAEGKGGKTVIHTVPLPENIDPTSADVVTALNEQLMQEMDGATVRDKKAKGVKEALERSRRQLQVLRHQTHLVYKQHFEEKSKWEDECKRKDEEKERLKAQAEKDAVRLQELDRLLDSLQRDPDTVKQRLAETTRKISLLRINEKSLIRHHKALEFSEGQLQVENSRMKNEIQQMERAVSERIGYLERYKEMAAYKIASLQKNLDASVPETELETANRKFDELTAKYRDLLQKENQFVSKNTKLDTLQAEIKVLNEELGSLRSELSIEKEKRHTLAEALQRIEGSTQSGSQSLSRDSMNYELSSILKKVTVLEMKELNERQRADHSSRMYNQVRSTVDALEGRNSELEEKFAELTKLNFTAQKMERELRDELAAAVPLTVSEADRKKIAKLEEEAAKMKVRMSKLQDMADIAQNQLKTLQSQQHGREREMKSLRQQVREFQVQDDDKSLLGKLHRQILTLQATEADQKLKLEKTVAQVRKLEAHVLKQEKLIDEKELMVYHVRTEATSRSRQLKKTIQSLRQQFSGALPLYQQEKFSQSMLRLQEDKAQIQEDLKKMRREREKLEDKLAEAEIKKESLAELKKTIKDGRGAQKVEEWCARMDALRLQDMKLQRQVVRQNEELKYLEKLASQHEKTIAGLEEDIVQMLKAQEKQQLEWERRETDLERMLDQFGIQQREVTKKAKRLQDVSALIPDPNLPLDIQLSKALETISKQTTSLKDLQGQLRFHERDNDRLKDRVHALEGDLNSRDRIINELRLRIPQSSTADAVKIVKSDIGLKNADSTQQLRVAMETIETLRKRLQQKEESLSRYKQLLEESHKEHEGIIRRHENELTTMQSKIHSKTDNAFNKFRQVAMDAMSHRASSAPTPAQLSKMTELQDMLKEQDAAMTALMERLRAANADVVRQKQALAEVRRQAEKDRNRSLEEHDRYMHKLRDELTSKEKSIDQLEKDLAITRTELDRQKEANARAPATTLKNLVARLKSQLEEKEVQQQKLSHALTELRADLVQQAQENVRAASEGADTNAAVQGLVQRKTALYRDEIDELKDKLAVMQRGLKQERQKQENLKSELKKILEEAENKTVVITRLKQEKHGLDQENNRLKDKVRRLAKAGDKPAGSPGVSIKFTESGAMMSLPPKKSSGESEDDESSDGAETPTEEDEIVAVDASKEDAPSSSRPQSAKAPKAPRNLYSSRDESEKSAKVKQLEEEVKKLKMELDKSAPPGKNAIEVAKWEAKKVWQGKVDTLKNKLQEKEQSVQVLEKQITLLREAVARLERDKLRRVGGGGAPIHAVGQVNESAVVDNLARREAHNIEDLSRRLHEASEENSRLRRESTLPREVIVAEMEARNKSLSERLEALEKEILAAGQGRSKATDPSVQQLHRDREDRFQSELLKLHSENAELRFEVEQGKIDIPRLKDRVEDQQRYIELLKAEKREAEIKADKMKVGQHRKAMAAGTSGKTVPELEKTVALMKKVVERVQRENDKLKKAPGVVSNEAMEGLKKENAQLKQRIDTMSNQIGGQLSSRYESKTLGVQKIVKENERMRNEVQKVKTARDKLQASKNTLQEFCEKQQAEMEQLKDDLRIAESRAPRLAGLGSKGYNSVVTNKMLEAKLKRCEDDMAEKESQVKDLRVVLEDGNKREKKLVDENEKLKEQVELLERFPPEAGGSDANTVRELQQARLTIANLEKTNKNLEEMLRVLRRHIASVKVQDGEEGTSLDDTMLAKLKEYDSTLEKNSRLGTELAIIKQERDRFKEEVSKLEKELSNFNEDFFDEIEDLKYNYSESVKRNIIYEDQLRNLSRQFGVEVNIPDDSSAS